MRHYKFSTDSLLEIFNFIETNEEKIKQSQTIAKQKTQSHYPVMKIVDMFFWQTGYDLEAKRRVH
jgi:hypothetical protein